MSEITSDDLKDYDVTTPLKASDSHMAIPDHRFNYRRKVAQPATATDHSMDCCKTCMAILLVVFILSTISLVIFILWREFIYQRCTSPTGSFNPHSPLLRFPGFFRNEEEQRNLVQLLHNSSSTVNANLTGNSTHRGVLCKTACGDFWSDFRSTDAGYTSNAHPALNSNLINLTATLPPDVLQASTCCLSTVTYIKPSFLVNFSGEQKRILQLDSHFQYLTNYSCRQTAACPRCRCVREMTIIAAVAAELHALDDKSASSIDYFPFPGSCQCILQPV